jgi:hypothetical protein
MLIQRSLCVLFLICLLYPGLEISSVAQPVDPLSAGASSGDRGATAGTVFVPTECEKNEIINKPAPESYEYPVAKAPLLKSLRYFPDDIDDFRQRWYSKQLRALQEPSLYQRQGRGSPVYRFTWLRTFHHPVVIRIEQSGSSMTIRAKAATGAGGYEPGKLFVNKKHRLSRARFSRIKKVWDDSGFWTSATNPKGTGGCDGAQWIFEARDDNGSYHVIDRWCPGGNFEELGIALLKEVGFIHEGRDFY